MTDDKDWTWVLDRSCPECGYDTQALERNALAGRIRAIGGSWRELLGAGPAVTRLVPGDGRTWSPLEYGCHVRDVLELFESRLRTMLRKKAPTFKNWDQNEAAVEGDYANQDADKVAYRLALNAGKYADVLDRLSEAEWERSGTRSDGVTFTVESFSRYLLHDIEHHLWDVRQQLQA